MDLDRQVIPEAYFDVRLPSRICLVIIVLVALSVAGSLLWFTHKTTQYINKTTAMPYQAAVER